MRINLEAVASFIFFTKQAVELNNKMLEDFKRGDLIAFSSHDRQRQLVNRRGLLERERMIQK